MLLTLINNLKYKYSIKTGLYVDFFFRKISSGVSINLLIHTSLFFLEKFIIEFFFKNKFYKMYSKKNFNTLSILNMTVASISILLVFFFKKKLV